MYFILGIYTCSILFRMVDSTLGRQCHYFLSVLLAWLRLASVSDITKREDTNLVSPLFSIYLLSFILSISVPYTKSSKDCSDLNASFNSSFVMYIVFFLLHIICTTFIIAFVIIVAIRERTKTVQIEQIKIGIKQSFIHIWIPHFFIPIAPFTVLTVFASVPTFTLYPFEI